MLSQSRFAARHLPPVLFLKLCQIVDINNMAIAVIVMVKLYQYVSATGKQFGLRIVSQQGDGIGKGGCAMVEAKSNMMLSSKSILPDGILHIIVLALAAVY